MVTTHPLFAGSGPLGQPCPVVAEQAAAQCPPPAAPMVTRSTRLAYSLARAAAPFVGMGLALPIGRAYLGRGC